MRVRKLLLALFVVSVFLCMGNRVSAMNTGFTTEEMTPEEQERFLSNVDLSLIIKEPKKRAIKRFDVNDDGLIAIGSEDSMGKFISVYTSDGTFQYGYRFDCSGDFGVEWDDDNIIIYFVRSDVAALYDDKGENIELREIQNTIDNNSYWNHVVYSNQRTVNGCQYTLRNDMGLFNFIASSYSQLVKTDADGSVSIIYDVNTEYTITVVMVFTAVVLFIIFVFYKIFQIPGNVKSPPAE